VTRGPKRQVQIQKNAKDRPGETSTAPLHALLVSPQCTTPFPKFNLKLPNMPPSTLDMLLTFIHSPLLLILRHSLGRRPISRSTTATMPTVRIHRHGTALRLSTTAKLLQLRLRAILDILPEIAHMAPNLLVWLQAERNNGDEAEGEPFPALHNFARGVTAVLAVECYVFGTFERGCEG
jgi:hypothetical protein